MLCATCGKEIERATTCPVCNGVAELRGEYRLVRVIGRGANGVTYEAERISDGHRVAVKETPIGTMDGVKALELFEREAAVLRQLAHPAIPRYEADFAFGIGKASALYLVQELVDGETIAKEAEGRRYGRADVWAIVGEIAGILEYLHGLAPPVVHRDVKPSNVMRRRDGSLCLIDFGSVREAMKARGGSTVTGTFGYMAPEQLAGKATAASDLYALGALACALLARKEPDAMLDDEHLVDFESHLEADEDEWDLLTDLLARDPADRPASAREVRERAFDLTKPKESRTRPYADAPFAPKEEPAGEPRDAQVPWNSTSKGPDRERRHERVRDERDRAREPSRPAPTPKPRATRHPAEVLAERETKRSLVWVAVAVGVGVLVSGVTVGVTMWRKKSGTVPITAAAPPEIYARPLAVDTNGDGVVDVVSVVGVDEGPKPHGPDEVDTFGQTDGRFVPHVQAIDGATGRPLYTLAGLGESFASNPSLEGKMPRTVLAAFGARLLVVRIAPNETVVEAVDLGTGKSLQSASFEPSSGAACDRAGKLVLGRRGPGAIVIDPATLARADGAAACGPGSASANVADAPDPKASSQSKLEARFSTATKIASGPDAGAAAIVGGGRVAFVRVPKTTRGSPDRSGPSISFSEAGGQAGGVDNGEIRVVVADETTLAPIVAPSLLDLGLAWESVDHLAFVGREVLLVLVGESGFLRMGEDGKAKWRRELPKGTRVLSYTIARDRAYLHTVETGNTIYGFLSKKVRSRILVLDLVSGAWVRSIPEGPLDPTPPRPAYEPKYEPVTGCVCPRASGSPEVALVMGTSSTLQTGGKTYYGAHFAIDVDGTRRSFAPYAQKRERIVPPRTLEGMVPLAMACGEGRVVFAHEGLATSWSLATGKEEWTVELARSRGARPTSLGGAATLKCDLGTIAGGVARLPALDGTAIAVGLAAGAPADAGAGDAGAAKNPGKPKR